MLLRTKLIMIFFFFIVGCANGSKALLHHNEPAAKTVSVGMTKTELIEIKGEPDQISASGGYEYLTYMQQAHLFDPAKRWDYMFIKGKLWQYGPAGSFETTKKLDVKITRE